MALLPLSSVMAKPGLSDYKTGYRLYQQGYYEKAIRYFCNAVDEDMDFWQCYQMIGNCYFQLRQKNAALAAYQECLRIHPNNSTLIKDCRDLTTGAFDYPLQPVDEEKPKYISKIAPPVDIPSEVLAQVSGMSVKTPAFDQPVNYYPRKNEGRNPLWFKLDSTYGFTGTGDLGAGVVAWNKNLAQNGEEGYVLARNAGIEMGLETGYSLDPKDAVSVGLSYLGGQGYSVNLVSSSSGVLQSINPDTYSASLNYYRYFPVGKNRFFVMGGLGYYLSMVSYYQQASTQPIYGNLSGGNIGAEVGIGNEWFFTKSVGLELSGSFRYANIPKVQGTVSGLSAGPSTAALAIQPNGTVGIQSTQYIGGGISDYASIDYTGIDLKLSMDLYLF